MWCCILCICKIYILEMKLKYDLCSTRSSFLASIRLSVCVFCYCIAVLTNISFSVYWVHLCFALCSLHIFILSHLCLTHFVVFRQCQWHFKFLEQVLSHQALEHCIYLLVACCCEWSISCNFVEYKEKKKKKRKEKKTKIKTAKSA